MSDPIIQKAQYESLRFFLEEIGVNLFFIQKDFSNLYLSDGGMKQTLFENYRYAPLRQAAIRVMEEMFSVYTYTDSFDINAVILRLPECSFMEAKDLPLLVAGPFSIDSLSGERIQVLQHTNHIGESTIPIMKQFLEAIPVLPETIQLATVISRFFSRMFAVEFRTTNPFVYQDPSHVKNFTPDESYAVSITERYKTENLLLAAVQAGDLPEALKYYDEFVAKRGMQERTLRKILNRQNYTIILNTILRKAAENSGVHPLYIDYYSSKFAFQINQATTVNYLTQLSRRMVEEYTILVKEKNISRYSAKIRQIILYTDFHYPEPLSLEYFAWNLNVSKTYLSHLFRQELGVPLTEYIRKVRMEKAAKLLKTSSLTLEEVAKSVGYANPNYFTLHFKATYHITPKQFQKSSCLRDSALGNITYCQSPFFQ